MNGDTRRRGAALPTATKRQFVTLANTETVSPKTPILGRRPARTSARIRPTLSAAAGQSRRTRRAQNRGSDTPPASTSRTSSDVIRNPDSVKKVETPR